MTTTVHARRCAFGGVILLAGCLLLAACAGGSSTSASSPGAAAPRGVLAAPHAASGSSAAQGASAAGRPAGLTANLAPSDESIIYTASIEVRARDVTAAARRVTAIVEAVGGYVSNETAGSGGSSTAGETIGITVKIPVPAYPAALAQLSSPALGKQLHMSQQATDVTQEVANVNSLVTSEQDAINALDGLLQHAASVADLLQVQKQISADQSTLNSLLAQQRALNGETSYATVAMTLVSPQPPAPHKKPAKHSFLTGLLAGWRALRHAGGWLLTAVGAALPFFVIAAVLAGLGYAGRRRYLRRRAGESTAG